MLLSVQNGNLVIFANLESSRIAMTMQNLLFNMLKNSLGFIMIENHCLTVCIFVLVLQNTFSHRQVNTSRGHFSNAKNIFFKKE